MIKQLILPFLGVAAVVIIVGMFVKNPSRFGFNKNSMNGQVSEDQVKVKNTKVKVTIVDDEDERKKGLSGTSSLEDLEGMLFVFDKKDTEPSFWMKDMIISIDIIWINDGKVLKIDKNVPLPEASTPDYKLPLYKPGGPIDYVLEVNAGFSDKNGISAGDSVELPSQLTP